MSVPLQPSIHLKCLYKLTWLALSPLLCLCLYPLLCPWLHHACPVNNMMYFFTIKPIFITINLSIWQTHFRHLPYIFNHCHGLGYFIPLHNRITAKVLAFLEPCELGWRSRPLTLVSICKALSCLSSTKLKRNQFTDTQTQTNLRDILFKITKIDY